ncbi:type 1 glutamine amidotransferase-like domain-containing protein [archaeon]|jgi:dipeptidase E|nr:type 1 glutamine amidotransferase-like domain-containing protein [archaeon]MBT4022613.1 type 1 glutamine amidotransferase-like domain-containing protein [archaeon]MBT4272053.1 type 1 glutamine amidotransferase-like domain-containing protein [archaeon]MBT4461150.1 type 1 glutamine amidotransferase-like domain-containing protein [archaeon]MBT4858857.1 type 1 glutamine amidotransferase-like domain-containing protein [archaeon]
MKKLFLTSVTPNVMGEFVKFLGKEPSKTKVAFIANAADLYENKWFIDDDRKKWKELGFNLIEIDIRNKNYSELKKELETFDVIYVAGGNTFYLLQETLKSGLNKIIIELLEKGVIYCGGSAGAVLVCPSIESVKVLDDPKLAPELETYDALNLVDFIVLPHYSEKYKDTYNKIIADYKNCEFVKIDDNQAIIVEGDKYRII